MLENIKQAKNWEDRYRFIIQAGKHLSSPSPDAVSYTHLVVFPQPFGPTNAILSPRKMVVLKSLRSCLPSIS